MIAPLLANDTWPAESVALVIIETSVRDAKPSTESREAWSHEARTLIQRCVLPDLDVLLPIPSPGAEGDRFFVAAFADEEAALLANRIRQQFDRLPSLKNTDRTCAVSYCILPPVPREVGATREHTVARMATRLEDSITSHILTEAVSP